MRLYFSTPAWGAAHVRLFLSIGLPSLLAPGNLSGLAEASRCRYYIYTRSEDRSALENAPVIHRLHAIMPVEIIPIHDEITVPHRTMSECHMDTMRRADKDGVPAVFIPPDCVWSDGSMMRLEKIAQSGKSVVHMSGVRLDRDAVVANLKQRVSDDGCVLTVPSQELVEVGLKHLHPIAYTHFWNEHAGGLMPANLYWTVPGEGLLLRCFHLHPLMVKSQIRFVKFQSTIDDDLALCACPEASQDYIVTDSDEILAFELSGLNHVVGTVCAKGSVEGAAGWSEIGTNERHRLLAQNAIRLHAKPVTDASWRPIEKDSKRVIDAIVDLNRSPTYALALKHPAVCLGRVYAASLGRGTHAGSRTGLATAIIKTVALLRRVNSAVYLRIFFHNGEPRMTHPHWLIRRSLLVSLRSCLSRADRSVALVGPDYLAGSIKRCCPDLTMLTMDPTTLPDWTSTSSTFRSNIDVFIAIDLDQALVKPPPDAFALHARLAKRAVWLRLGRGPRTIANGAGYELRWFGGLGTRVSQMIWQWVSALRTVTGDRMLLLKMPAKFAWLISQPVLLPIVALGGFGLNLTALALDALSERMARVDVADTNHATRIRG